MAIFVYLTMAWMLVLTTLESKADPYLREFYPPQALAEIAALDRDARGNYGAVDATKRWSTGTTLIVAFNGGTYQQRQLVEQAAVEWTRHANINLKFRYERNRFNEWSPRDVQFRADIRISFDSRQGNYSLLGKDSKLVGRYIGPNFASMNLGQLHRILWKRTVIHEFGHALGLIHEHQRVNAPCNFRWNSEEGYIPSIERDTKTLIPDKNEKKPGVFDYYANIGWSRTTTRDQVFYLIRPFESSFGLPYDVTSVMHYAFPPYLLFDHNCAQLVEGGNTTLSRVDREVARRAYPGR